MKLFSSCYRLHLRSPSVSTRIWPVPLPQPTVLKVGHPPLAVTLRVLRLTSERQLAECLHPAVMCFWLDPPPTKGWAQGKAQRQRISGGVNKRYTLQLVRVVCGSALCACRPAAARWAPSSLDFPDLPPKIRMQLCFCLCWPCRCMEVCYECIVMLLSFRLGDYWLNRASFIYLFRNWITWVAQMAPQHSSVQTGMRPAGVWTDFRLDVKSVFRKERAC